MATFRIVKFSYLLTANKLSILRPSVCRLSNQPTKTPESPVTKTGVKKPVEPAKSSPEPSDNKTYKVPEYYSFNDMSFYDIESLMSEHRLKQPSKYDPMQPGK